MLLTSSLIDVLTDAASRFLTVGSTASFVYLLLDAEFEEAAHKREHEYRLHIDQLNAGSAIIVLLIPYNNIVYAARVLSSNALPHRTQIDSSMPVFLIVLNIFNACYHCQLHFENVRLIFLQIKFLPVTKLAVNGTQNTNPNQGDHHHCVIFF